MTTYRQEIRARQAVEDVACQWLVELGVSNTPRLAMITIRQRTEAERQLRPTMSPRDVAAGQSRLNYPENAK